MSDLSSKTVLEIHRDEAAGGWALQIHLLDGRKMDVLYSPHPFEIRNADEPSAQSSKTVTDQVRNWFADFHGELSNDAYHALANIVGDPEAKGHAGEPGTQMIATPPGGISNESRTGTAPMGHRARQIDGAGPPSAPLADDDGPGEEDGPWAEGWEQRRSPDEPPAALAEPPSNLADILEWIYSMSDDKPVKNMARAAMDKWTTIQARAAEPPSCSPPQAIRTVIEEMVQVATSGDPDDMTQEWTADNRDQIDRWQCRLRDAITSGPPSEPRPIRMVLFCPACHEQHIDAPDERTPGWTNPPHKSHLCHKCGTIWRPCDLPTEGVRFIETLGKSDTWPKNCDHGVSLSQPCELCRHPVEHTTSTKVAPPGDRCGECDQPLPPVSEWSMPTCPACVDAAEKIDDLAARMQPGKCGECHATCTEDCYYADDPPIGCAYRPTVETSEPQPTSADDETPCAARDDGMHCECWYGGNTCCGCGDGDRTLGGEWPTCAEVRAAQSENTTHD